MHNKKKFVNLGLKFFFADFEGSIFFRHFQGPIGCPSLYDIGAQGPSTGGALPLRPGEWGLPEAKGL